MVYKVLQWRFCRSNSEYYQIFHCSVYLKQRMYGAIIFFILPLSFPPDSVRKYCPLLGTTFSHVSDSIRIPIWKNASSLDAIHEIIEFLISSYDVKCFSDKPSIAISRVIVVHPFFITCNYTMHKLLSFIPGKLFPCL